MTIPRTLRLIARAAVCLVVDYARMIRDSSLSVLSPLSAPASNPLAGVRLPAGAVAEKHDAGTGGASDGGAA